MEFFQNIIHYPVFLLDYLLHFDVHLRAFCANYGEWVYLLLFLIVFCETGLVVTPFLPGDSLLFAAGMLSAQGLMDVWGLWALLLFAGIVGDTVNYSTGRKVGPHVFSARFERFFKREYLEKAHAFYQKYGGRAIVIARFIPIMRTFVPFVAGMARMDYKRFIWFNVTGGFAWVTGFLFAGYGLGNIPGIQQNFKFIILLIIFVSVLPIAVEFCRVKLKKA